jgi:hypothetical protein
MRQEGTACGSILSHSRAVVVPVAAGTMSSADSS